MPRAGDGSYKLPAGNPVQPGTTIESSWANATLSDIAAQLNNVLTRDGLLGPTSPLQLTQGTVVEPALAFATEPGLGFYRKSNGELALAVGGVDVATWSTHNKQGTVYTADLLQVRGQSAADVMSQKAVDDALTAVTSGNVASATRLKTPRNIAGHAFDGTADISIATGDLTDAGTASRATLTTSNADTTGGRVVRVDNFGIGNNIGLGAGVDLNTLIRPADYVQSLDVSAASGSNYPEPHAGHLQVRGDGTGVVLQRYQVYSGTGGACYNRGRYNNVWSVWALVADSMHLAGSLGPDGEIAISQGAATYWINDAKNTANSKLSKSGDTATGSIAFGDVSDAGAIRVTKDIGSSFASWTQSMKAAVQQDCPSWGSAYAGIRWTRLGGRHLAAIMCYEGNSGSAEPRIYFMVDGFADPAWSFGRNTIIRESAGGEVIGTWNTQGGPGGSVYPMSQAAVTNFVTGRAVVWNGGEWSMAIGNGRSPRVPTNYAVTGWYQDGGNEMLTIFARALKVS